MKTNFKLYKPNLADFISEAVKEGVKIVYITSTSRVNQLMIATFNLHVTCFLPSRPEPMLLLLEIGSGMEHQRKELWERKNKAEESVTEKLLTAGLEVRRGVISDEPVPGTLAGIFPEEKRDITPPEAA